MLTTLSILSLDQGKLHARPTSEDAYFARFATPLPDEKAEPRFTFGSLWPHFGRQADHGTP